MRRLPGMLILLGLVAYSWVSARAGDVEGPFKAMAWLGEVEQGLHLHVGLEIDPGHFLYADQFSVALSSEGRLEPVDVPAPIKVYDKFSEAEKEVYKDSFEAVFLVVDQDGAVEVEVGYQGCSDAVCFFPETRKWSLDPRQEEGDRTGSAARRQGESEGAWKSIAARFDVVGRETGYVAAPSFIEFMDRVEAASAGEVDQGLSGRGVWLAILLIVLGGIVLNLTPCVLPMIPINIAIIGAGAQAGSRKRGFALGATYGLGIAMAYGVLGVVVVLSGSKFGALNASPWFNWTIAVIFVVLALALFGVFNIDLSRLQNRLGGGPKMQGKAGYSVAFGMGSLVALLAGACVAPVVISVLVWSGDLYARGVWAGLLLPFLLGLGMGLPWPFAGAGLSFLPKPGGWMTWVERGFGVLVLVLALYYGHLGYSLMMNVSSLHAREGSGGAVASGRWENERLAKALEEALDAGTPVFVDFWASWCKNCLAMEKTTFKDPEVADRLGTYRVFKYAAEKPNEQETKEVLDHFGVFGLPTYVILRPKSE